MKKIIASFLVILMIFSLCACGNTESASKASKKISLNNSKSYSIKYDIKINPEFTVYADDDLCVTEITAENNDAENVLAAVEVVGLNVNEVFEAITNEAKTQGYMTTENGNSVDITILEKDDQKMPTCPICNGCGKIVCNVCNGTGIACSCDRCKGTGIEYHSDASPKCPHCGGSGICSECKGVGKIVVTNGEDGGIVYTSEGVPEMGICPGGCNGTGVCMNCHALDYSGNAVEIICGGCNGTGELICRDDLNGYIWCPCCWGSGIEGTGNPDYKVWMAENGY